MSSSDAVPGSVPDPGSLAPEEVTSQWWQAREAVTRLRKEGRGRHDAGLQEAKKRLESAVRVLGPLVSERPTILDPPRFEPLVKDLKAALEFGVARSVIESATGRLPEERHEWFRQQLALCTYKDEEMVPVQRFRRALAILDELDRTVPEPSSETVALRGAVRKRMWQYGGQLDDLYAAANDYLHAWTRDRAADRGYGGVNAAYLMDVLAGLERSVATDAGPEAPLRETWSTRARALREEMRDTLPGLVTDDDKAQYWYCVTLAEIYWGLEDWASAAGWLEKAEVADASEWELQTTVQQLVSIARMRGVPSLPEGRPDSEWHPAWRALLRVTGRETPSVVSCHRGKVGLALSGGGFRAALFHLGVLARLAEMNVLRSIEVLSTVSGGSIVGALYYLALRKELQTRVDAELTRERYVELVKRVQECFLAGIGKNLRMRGLSNLLSNLKVVLPGPYTRSNRMGELYEAYIYSEAGDGHPRDAPRRLRDLLIHPCVEAPGGERSNDRDFKPKFSNWRRRAKVPILLLNTTSLNTGHNWHFTARWMGEPPGLLGPEAETIPRYRRLWYEEAPTSELREYRLGYAVAASACVPSLFEPLELRELYPGRTVRLVDGGVHDNQGVAGLLDEGCTLVLCSDASGQMGDSPAPSRSLVAVPLRSNSIAQDRLREAQYLDLESRRQSHALQGLFFVHLKQELTQDPITWIGGKLRERARQPTDTSYGVDRDLQGKLAAIRTDLDSFSEVEAHSLMASGYLMTKREFERLDEEHVKNGGTGTWGDFAIAAPSRGAGYWSFLALAPLLALPPDHSDRRRADLGRQLSVASSRFLKAFRLSKGLGVAGVAVLAAAIVGLGWFVYRGWYEPVGVETTVGAIVLAVAMVAGGFIWRGIKLANPESYVRGWLFKLALAVLAWVLTNFHLALVDPVFRGRGRVERLLRLR